MVLNSSIVIDLTEYGGEGFIEVGYPSLRKQDIFGQKATSLLTSYENGKPTMNIERAVEANKYEMLAYIDSAPFELTPDAYYDFTDALDRKRRGAGRALDERIHAAIDEINEGGKSPSPDSQGAENARLV